MLSLSKFVAVMICLSSLIGTESLFQIFRYFFLIFGVLIPFWKRRMVKLSLFALEVPRFV